MHTIIAAALVALTLSVAVPATVDAAQGDCGQPVTGGDQPAASDALAVLRAAVGTSPCATCVCDVDGNGRILAADALATLRRAVGQAGGDACLSCRVEAVIGPDGGTLVSGDNLVSIEFPAGAFETPTTVSIAGIPASELPPPANQGEDIDAYELEPDGQILGAPATVRTTGAAVPIFGAAPGVLGSAVVLLSSSDGSVLEVLADQGLFIDGDDGTATASATISHFSQLAVIPTGLGVQLENLPESSVVDAVVAETVTVLDDDDLLDVSSATYVDDDFGAWQPTNGGIAGAALAATGDGGFTDDFDYKCAGVAQVFHSPRLDTVYDIDAGTFQANDVAHTTLLRKTIDCQP